MVRMRDREFSTIPGDAFGVKVCWSRTPGKKTVNLHILNPEVFEVLPQQNLDLFEKYRDQFFKYLLQCYPDHRPEVRREPPTFAKSSKS